MKRLKQEKGSITLFVVVSMLFFVLFLTGIYMIATSKEQTGISETKRIKEIYEKDINRIDDVYQTVEEGLKQNLKDVIKVGDYVAYDPTKGVANKDLLSYTSEIGTGMSHGNGHSKQTFTVESNTKWRVLSKDEMTGEVVLISEAPMHEFTMYGAIGYLYAEQELNEICKIYGYGIGASTSKTFSYEIGDVVEGVEKCDTVGSGARSINLDDISEIMGIDVTESDDYGTAYTHTVHSPTRKTLSGITESKVNITDVNTYYGYNGETYIKDTQSAIYQMLFGNKDMYYRIASRCVAASTGSKYVYVDHVNMGAVGGGSYLCHGYVYNNNAEERGEAMGVRPIVYLKSNIQTSGKDASGVWIISE